MEVLVNINKDLWCVPTFDALQSCQAIQSNILETELLQREVQRGGRKYRLAVYEQRFVAGRCDTTITTSKPQQHQSGPTSPYWPLRR